LTSANAIEDSRYSLSQTHTEGKERGYQGAGSSFLEELAETSSPREDSTARRSFVSWTTQPKKYVLRG